MAMTIEQFGQSIKQKYPQYKDVNDNDLGTKMLEKYPQYGNVISQEGAEKNIDTFVKSQPVVSKIGKFLGMESFGKGIGQAIFFNLTSEGRDFLKDVRSGKIDAEAANQFFQNQPVVTPTQVGGSAVSTALNVGTFGGAGLAGKLGVRAAKTAALGTGFAGARQLEEEGKVTPGGLATGAATGAALPVAGAGLRGVGRGLTEQLPKRLVQSVLRQGKQATLKRDVAPFVLSRKKMGTANKLIQDSESNIQKLNNQIAQNIKQVQGTVELPNIFAKTAKGIDDFAGLGISENDVATEITKIIPQASKLMAKKSLTVTEAENLRKALGKTLGDRGFISGQDTFRKTVAKSFYGNLVDEVRDRAPQGTREAFEELSKEITLKTALLEKAAAQSGNAPISLFDFLGGGLGGAFGGGIPGALLGVGAVKTIRSTPFATGAGVGLSQLGRLQPILDKLSPAERTLLLNALGAGVAEENQQNQTNQNGI